MGFRFFRAKLNRAQRALAKHRVVCLTSKYISTDEGTTTRCDRLATDVFSCDAVRSRMAFGFYFRTYRRGHCCRDGQHRWGSCTDSSERGILSVIGQAHAVLCDARRCVSGYRRVRSGWIPAGAATSCQARLFILDDTSATGLVA